MDPSVLPVIQTALSDAAPKLAQLSKFLWDNPELGLQEEKAHDTITQLLHDLGFRVERHAVLPTAFIASHSSSEEARPHVALMCEYDALPGVGHACGHNLIATSAVGAGLAVRAAMLSCGIEGRVSVFGTPAEESNGGKIDLINAGKFRDVDAAMMVHPIGGVKNILRSTFNASQAFVVKFKGKATHAASNPWEGVNALDAAVLAYQNVAALRQHLRPGWRAAGIISKGGEAANVIPDHTEMSFTLRTPTRRDGKELAHKFRSCMDAAATATGCSCEIVDFVVAYDDVLHSKTLAKAFGDHARSCGVTYEEESAFGASTDMGNVSYEVPSIHPMFQIGSTAQLHEKDFTKDTGTAAVQQFVIEQSTILALTAVEVLTNEQLREDIQNEFEASKMEE